ncbi:hypothetical protein G7Y89_g6768 [Cudoniella acicularis]|uniref:Heterokaryon incompatibility domain-containing protein n=1 Tax=Cudoniella acicularis TaxID=354080 RepID=A0A8H4RKN7_9HELO|nr:hypothetical protein G7Y89_g6768 [Cudoniella acicularis]
MAQHIPLQRDFDYLNLIHRTPWLRLAPWVVTGIVCPIVDSSLDDDTLRVLSFAIACFEPTSLLWVLNLLIFFLRQKTTTFRTFAHWLGLSLSPAIAQYLRDEADDIPMSDALALHEWGMIAHFSPSIAIRIAKVLWSFKWGVLEWTIKISLAFLIAVWWKPRRWAELRRLTPAMLYISYNWVIAHEVTGRGILRKVLTALSGSLMRWEVRIVRRKRRPFIPDRYKYEPLQTPGHVRLLRVGRRLFFQEPRCEIFQVPLSEAPEFEAISYTWGKHPPSIPISVNGRHLLVTKAVEDLVLYMQSIFKSKIYWVDALCINQHDIDERNQQVPRMRDIYQKATRVLVWLGPSPSIGATLSTNRMIRTLNWVKTESVETVQLLPIIREQEEHLFRSLVDLFTHEWWHRMWIIQEIAVGKSARIRFNDVWITWESLSKVIYMILRDPDLEARLLFYFSQRLPPQIARKYHLYIQNALFLCQTRDRLQTQTPAGDEITFTPAPLATLIHDIFHFESKDPRDKIFAIFGIISDANMPFEPDYLMPVSDIFLKTTTHLLSRPQWFKILSVAGLGYERLQSSRKRDAASHCNGENLEDDLPSWVPDYSNDKILGTIATNSILHGFSQSNVSFMDNNRSLQLKASAFDEIAHLGSVLCASQYSQFPPNPATVLGSEALKHFITEGRTAFCSWYIDTLNFLSKYYPPEHEGEEPLKRAKELLWQLCMWEDDTVIQDDEGNKELKANPEFSVLDWHCRTLWEKYLLSDVDTMLNKSLEAVTGLPLNAQETRQLASQLFRRLYDNVQGKRVAITKRGNIALVPPLVESEDVFVSVENGFIPVLLRKKGGTDTDNVAQLVGMAFVLHLVPIPGESSSTLWKIV